VVTILFDATRLFMRAAVTSPTGIDRVIEAYGRWLVSRPDVRLVPVCSLGGVISPLSLGRFKQVLAAKQPRAAPGGGDWARLEAALDSPDDSVGTLRARPARGAMLSGPVARYAAFGARTMVDWRPSRLDRDPIYLNVGHFGLEQRGLLERLTAKGARPMAMVHDLIPIIHPEYCSTPAAGWHARRIDTLLAHAALIIANSASTADDLTKYADASDAKIPPVCVAPLGLETAFLGPSRPGPGGRPYFVCVGTIEPRKNVAFLLTLWRRLAENMGDATPRLVLAGRRGWENEAIIDHLERSPPIRRFVHEITGLDDEQLAQLIGGANALLAPSFSEGFDLPVAEAAAMGTPVIASDIPVHRELAGYAQLLDPLDGPAWLMAITKAAIRRPQVVPIQPTTWSTHFRIVGEAMGLPSA
jgi:glycosyltransferase involved in cell wall biosynthesis